MSIKKNVVILHPLSIVGKRRATYPFRPEVQYDRRKIQRCELGAKSADLRYPSRENGARNPRQQQKIYKQNIIVKIKNEYIKLQNHLR